MHQYFKILSFSFCFTCVAVNAQTNILHQLQIANPVKNEFGVSLPANLKIHEAFMHKAVDNKNINQQFYGLLFLYDDQVDMHDYTGAKKYAIEAEKIATNSGNKSFEGYVKTKSGWIDQLVQQYIPVALKKSPSVAGFSPTAGEIEQITSQHQVYLAMATKENNVTQ